MKQAYVDANVIIRLITGDPPDMADKAARLFKQVDDGTLELVVDEIVVAEVIWVLSSFYGFSANQIAPVMTTFLISSGILCDNKTELLQALTLYENKNVDFIDALLVVKMQKHEISSIYSFDKHFDRLESITRIKLDELV
ncbi:MAG TPA: PIN domain-containing protein [Armatimonadota bacterium]|nr:PIN domain-containing protein [Armatimonadota bacterium]